MNPEQFLQPRYKVTADYPLSKLYFNVGDILYWNEQYESYRIDEKQVAMNKDTVESFPHLFRPLQWWEDREEKDLPKFVKHGENGKPRKVFEYVLRWNEVVFEGGRTRKINKDWLPATETEYNSYLKSKQ